MATTAAATDRSLTPGQEMARAMTHALDPATWARDCLGFDPDPWQAEFLRSTSRQVILCCSRQSGKSTCSAILAAHTAVFRPGSTGLLISRAQRQSSELFAKVSGFLKSLDPPPILDADNVLSAKLANGSRIISLPGDSASTIRGYSAPALVVEDEAAYVDDQLYQALRPMMAVGKGRLLLLSTPHGRRGHFYDAATYGGPEWERFSVTADQCPRISAAFLASERSSIGEWWYQQEYQCQFIDTTDQLFSSESIQAAVTPLLKPLTLRIGP